MIRKVFIVCSFVLSLKVIAQANPATYSSIGSVINGAKQSGYSTLSVTSTGLHKKNVKGSPLLFNKYVNGVIELNDGRSFRISDLNINLFKGVFFAKIDDKSNFIFINVKSLKTDNKTYIQKGNMVLEELAKGNKITLLKHIYKEKKNISPDRLNPFGQEKWKENEEYYLLKNNKTEKIKLKERILLSFFEKSEENNIKKYIKNNKLSLKKEKDVIKVINYYNSLQ